jgi:hypothetical protein
MQEYFKNLDTVDPLFHALVIARLRLIEETFNITNLSINDLSEQDELEILREYCQSLYKEYRTMRTLFLENMVVHGRSVTWKHKNN